MRRKRLIARRPRPDLEFFLIRYEQLQHQINRPSSGSRANLNELESRMRLQDRR